MINEDRSKPSDRPRLCAILPAYNEGEELAEVLATLSQVPELDEILIVDDGSTDDTATITLNSAENDTRIRLIQLSANQGKGQAIFYGAAATQADALLLLDADLKDLKPEHIHNLVEPVLAGRADMSLGLIRSGHLNTDLSHRATPWLSGQRCLKADLLNNLDTQAAAGYGFETALTISTHQQLARTQVVFLTGVWHPPSEMHRGFLKGVGQRVRMYGHICRAWLRTRRSAHRLRKFEVPG